MQISFHSTKRPKSKTHTNSTKFKCNVTTVSLNIFVWVYITTNRTFIGENSICLVSFTLGLNTWHFPNGDNITQY